MVEEEEMSRTGKALLDYLHQQFPATVGHTPLVNMIDEIHKEGLVEGARRGAFIVHNMSRGTKSEERAAVIDEARDLIIEEVERFILYNSPVAKPPERA